MRRHRFAVPSYIFVEAEETRRNTFIPHGFAIRQRAAFTGKATSQAQEHLARAVHIGKLQRQQAFIDPHDNLLSLTLSLIVENDLERLANAYAWLLHRSRLRQAILDSPLMYICLYTLALDRCSWQGNNPFHNRTNMRWPLDCCTASLASRPIQPVKRPSRDWDQALCCTHLRYLQSVTRRAGHAAEPLRALWHAPGVDIAI